ncbi:hypothetical protein F4825DRAFT_417873 [Nemania diffusa]|nr:hypothetical protein F4825DRAFT_417873 [Nemania diffusa]
MLEYFSSKKAKKHREEKAAKQKLDKGKEKENPSELGTAHDAKAEAKTVQEEEAPPIPPRIISQPPDHDEDGDNDDVMLEGTPVLDREDEKFLERLTSPDAHLSDDDDDDGPPPPLPPRVKTPVIDIDSDSSSVSSKEAKAKGKEKDTGKGKDQKDKHKRFTFTTSFLRRKPAAPSTSSLSVPSASPPHESTDLAHILDDLDLSARNNRAVSLSAESAAMAHRFTQVLKDLVHGVPTAYADLVALLDDRDGLLARNFEKLPSSLKKLVAQLPEKLTSSLAPELLAAASAAAEAQGLQTSASATGAGLKGAAKTFFAPGNLQELVTKPGALVGLLKGIVNVLKTRFPAFVGTNVLWSLAVFLLLSMLWYCHKRGREVRLEREAKAAGAAAAAAEGIEGPRVEELPDDPMLGPPGGVKEGVAG